jgi:hypothetical protein
MIIFGRLKIQLMQNKVSELRQNKIDAVPGEKLLKEIL